MCVTKPSWTLAIKVGLEYSRRIRTAQIEAKTSAIHILEMPGNRKKEKKRVIRQM